jgi:hypothetical protein
LFKSDKRKTNYVSNKFSGSNSKKKKTKNKKQKKKNKKQKKKTKTKQKSNQQLNHNGLASEISNTALPVSQILKK